MILDKKNLLSETEGNKIIIIIRYNIYRNYQ